MMMSKVPSNTSNSLPLYSSEAAELYYNHNVLSAMEWRMVERSPNYVNGGARLLNQRLDVRTAVILKKTEKL